MIGINDKIVKNPVCSRIITYDIPTVNIGAELLTVSVKETATNFKATRPSTTVENLKVNKSRNDKTLARYVTFLDQNTCIVNSYLSRDERKPDFCLGKNKGVDQLCSNCTAD